MVQPTDESFCVIRSEDGSKHVVQTAKQAVVAPNTDRTWASRQVDRSDQRPGQRFNQTTPEQNFGTNYQDQYGYMQQTQPQQTQWTQEWTQSGQGQGRGW